MGFSKPFGDIEKFSKKKRKMKTFKQSHRAEKCKRGQGGPFTLIRFCRLRLKSKKPKGDPLETKKNSKNVAQCRKKRKGGPFGDKNFRKNFAQCRKKIERGDPLVSSGFVGYVKNERGTLCTKFPLTGHSLGTFSSFCKKWTDQCEVCGLKKRVTVRGKCAD